MDGGDGVWVGRLEGGIVLEGEEGAEAVGKRCVFRAEGVTEGWDGVTECGLWWGFERCLCSCSRRCGG